MAAAPAEQDSDGMLEPSATVNVVANVVGVLILLVMLMAAKATSVRHTDMPTPSVAMPAPPRVTVEQVQDAERRALAARDQTLDTYRRAVDLRQRNDFREQEREVLATHNAQFEQEIAERRARLDVGQQRTYDLRVKLASAEEELERLSREQIALLHTSPESTELKVRPTPIARTVTEQEIMLRVRNDRIAVVPVEELIDTLRQQGGQQLLRRAGAHGTIGPLNGFRLHYKAVQESLTLPNGVAATRAFMYMEFKPVADDVGESVDQAFATGSLLDGVLSRNNPRRSVVTMWVYPDSFELCNTLREKLYERGYAVAVRPLPEFVEIAAGPSGSKSVAQ